MGTESVALAETVMHKWSILALGVFLCSYVPAAAQMPVPQILPAQIPVAPIMTIVRTVPARFFAPSFPPPKSLGKSSSHFSHIFVRTYVPDQNLDSPSPLREVKTLFLKQSSLLLVQFWGGRLRLDGFTSRLDMQNVQLGPSASGDLLEFRPRRVGDPGGPRSIGLFGVNLSFHFGQDAPIGHSTQIWRYLARIAGQVARP
jgi:hypothetical protein